VAVGVLVLIVVLAVMAGFEREVKSRLLGFTPHVMLQFAPFGHGQVIEDWGAVVRHIEDVEGVEEGYAQLHDFTLLEYEDVILPVQVRAIDTANAEQMQALGELVAKEKYGGNAEMGLGENAIVAEPTAKRFGLRVGERILLYSARNLNELARAYAITDREPLAVEFADRISKIRAALRDKMTPEEGREGFAFDDLNAIYIEIQALEEGPARPGEREILSEIRAILNSGEKSATGNRRLLPAGSIERAGRRFDSLEDLDMEKEDARVLKELREVVLPKELEVIGIFLASKHVVHPDVFVPLPTGQELKNLDGGVEAVGVRVEDPYHVEPVAERLEERLPAGWYVTTWKDQHRAWVDLIGKERKMMYFALSFIILVAAFCIAAVMFTVTIQKKQEIGVMKALGAVPAQVVCVFLYQGMVIGLFGSLLGVGLGLLVIRFRRQIHGVFKEIGFDFFPSDFHDIDVIPAHVNPAEVFWIAGGAFLLCALAAFLPAVKAARADAARCLRNF